MDLDLKVFQKSIKIKIFFFSNKAPYETAIWSRILSSYNFGIRRSLIITRHFIDSRRSQ
jgi:hypothetical protein